MTSTNPTPENPVPEISSNLTRRLVIGGVATGGLIAGGLVSWLKNTPSASNLQQLQKLWSSTYQHPNGDDVDWSRFQGKPLIINFWATDCPGCIKEMPQLADAYNKYKKQGIQIIAISMFYDPPSQVLNFIKKNEIPFPVVIDADNKIAQRFENIRLTPTSVLINQKGQIIDQIVGEIDFDNLEKLLSKNL